MLRILPILFELLIFCFYLPLFWKFPYYFPLKSVCAILFVYFLIMFMQSLLLYYNFKVFSYANPFSLVSVVNILRGNRVLNIAFLAFK